MRFVRAFAAAIAFSLMPAIASAQAWPAKPVKIVVPFAAGGATDVVARLLAQKLSEAWGQSVVVENRAGAGGQIAAQALKASAPDGHTFFLSHDHSISILPLVTKNPGFDPAVDFVPVAGFATFANALAGYVSVGRSLTSIDQGGTRLALSGGVSSLGSFSWSSALTVIAVSLSTARIGKQPSMSPPSVMT